MNKHPRQAERTVRPCGAGTAEVRSADLGRLNRQRGRVPTAERYKTHPAKLPGQGTIGLFHGRW